MKPHVKFGLLVGATGILLSLISYILGLDKSDTGQYIGWINVPIMIIALVFAIKEKRLSNEGGFISFGHAFKTGFLVVLIATAITAVYNYLYFSVINPGIKDYILQKQADKFEEQGMSGAQMEQALAMTEKFTTPVMASVWVFFGGLFLGTIVVLIFAAIMKKNNPQEIS